MSSMIGRFLARVWTRIKPLFSFAAKTVLSAAAEFINDPANQAAAAAAVRAAVQQGLSGDGAWAVAYAALKAQLAASGAEVARNWIDTLLQNAVFVVKNSDPALAEALPE